MSKMFIILTLIIVKLFKIAEDPRYQ